MAEPKNDQKIEIMAPVGSFEALEAAVKAGADAVYFGVGRLNMRSAMNVSFAADDLEQIAEFCRDNRVRSYLTINTIMYDEDLREMKQLVDRAQENDLSAVIACDPAVLSYCREVGIPVHISTQANITNIEAVAYYSQFADTVVLGRELSLKQIGKIVDQIRERQISGPSGDLVRIEIFVHGYFCMAVSGKCYLSLDLYNSSANRGQCQVPCQRRYLVIDQENGNELLVDNEYLLSARDLCTIDFIDQIIDSGATVLKIEGRKKGADYVYTATKCYREAIDSCLAGTYTPEKANRWMEELTTVYNRGFWSGYYLRKKVGEEEWDSGPHPRIVKDRNYVGKSLQHSEAAEDCLFEIEAGTVREGDELLIVGPKVGVVQVTAKDLKANDETADRAVPGDVLALPCRAVVGPKAKLYKVRFEKHSPLAGTLSVLARKALGAKLYKGVRQCLPGKFSRGGS